MKNKVLKAIICGLLACLLLICMAGCGATEEGETTQPAPTDEKTVTVIGAQNEKDSLPEGEFALPGQNDSITSNAKELGGSATLDIEYSDDETQPDEGKTPVTEPQWQPGIW